MLKVLIYVKISFINCIIYQSFNENLKQKKLRNQLNVNVTKWGQKYNKGPRNSNFKSGLVVTSVVIKSG